MDVGGGRHTELDAVVRWAVARVRGIAAARVIEAIILPRLARACRHKTIVVVVVVVVCCCCLLFVVVVVGVVVVVVVVVVVAVVVVVVVGGGGVGVGVYVGAVVVVVVVVVVERWMRGVDALAGAWSTISRDVWLEGAGFGIII